MGTGSYTPKSKTATIEDWTENTLYGIMLQTAAFPEMEASAAPFRYISFSPSIQANSLKATVYDDQKTALQEKDFNYMSNGQIYGELNVTTTHKNPPETIPMVFIISMVFMENDDDPDDVEKYISSITLINDPDTAGVMGAEEEGVLPGSVVR